MPSFFAPALKLISALFTIVVVVLVLSVNESVLVAEVPGPTTNPAGVSVPSPSVTIGVVEETARECVAKVKNEKNTKVVTANKRKFGREKKARKIERSNLYEAVTIHISISPHHE
jgi:hypothetical protein